MTDVLEKLLAREGVGRRPAASEDSASAAAAAAAWGAVWPEAILSFWRASDGLDLPLLDAHLLGTAEVRELAAGRFGESCREQGFVPLLDDHQGAHLGMLTREPLPGRIVQRPGAEVSRLVYRGFEGLLGGVHSALDLGEPADVYFSQTRGDFAADAPRTADDQAAADALLAADFTPEAGAHAVRLLAPDRLPQWRKLLQGDFDVRREALDRLQSFTATMPEVAHLLAEDRAALEAFADAVVAAVSAAGFEVGRRQGVFAEINGRWTNLEVYFKTRDVPRTLASIFGWPQAGWLYRHP